MNSRRRVVVTGLGALTPIGKNVAELWQGLLEGKNGISRITKFDPAGFGSQIAGEVKDFNPLDRLDRKEVKRLDPFAQYALYAAVEAVEDSGLLDYSGLDRNRVGVIIASGIGGIGTLESEMKKMFDKGPSRVSPFLVPMMIPDIAAGHIAIKYGFKGPNFCVVSACASSAHAIGESMRIIQRGDADVVVVGGTEAPIVKISIAGFSSARALSTRNDEPEKASRPFDAQRDGFVIGEGAGIVVLESLEHALKRNARIYAELKGYGATADAYHITAPDPGGEGAKRAMQLAIEDAGLSIEDIDYINAHGTSTKLNDKTETLAIKQVFGDRAYKIPISSTKSMIGHLLGAAGAVEFIVSVLSVVNDVVHQTRNYEYPDPECDLDYVPEGARRVKVNNVLSNSFGFGGHNASLIVGKFNT